VPAVGAERAEAALAAGREHDPDQALRIALG
jgi:hypothetical protein